MKKYAVSTISGYVIFSEAYEVIFSSYLLLWTEQAIPVFIVQKTLTAQEHRKKGVINGFERSSDKLLMTNIVKGEKHNAIFGNNNS